MLGCARKMNYVLSVILTTQQRLGLLIAIRVGSLEQDKFPDGHAYRGLSVVTFTESDSGELTVASAKSFDTYMSDSEEQLMVQFIADIAAGSVVAVACKDSCVRQDRDLGDAGYAALGTTPPTSYPYYALILDAVGGLRVEFHNFRILYAKGTQNFFSLNQNQYISA